MESEYPMNTSQQWLGRLALCATILSLSACAGMTEREKSTAIGAGAGAVGGAILSGGSAIGTVGGAAVGGVIGNQVGK
jgi:osmotically inducible lipoprotein OsmB